MLFGIFHYSLGFGTFWALVDSYECAHIYNDAHILGNVVRCKSGGASVNLKNPNIEFVPNISGDVVVVHVFDFRQEMASIHVTVQRFWGMTMNNESA